MKTDTVVETTTITRIHLEQDEQFVVEHYARGNPTGDYLLVDTITLTRNVTDGEREPLVRRLDGYRIKRDGKTGATRIGRILDYGETTPATMPSAVHQAISEAAAQSMQAVKR